MGVKRAFVAEVHMYEVFAWGTAVRFCGSAEMKHQQDQSLSLKTPAQS